MAVAKRALNAILGAFVADAATMPVHWIYDLDEMAKILGGKPAAFFSPPSCPYYKYEDGILSPIGQQALIYLESISSLGKVDPVAIMTSYNAHYKPGGAFSDHSKFYHDASTRRFLANVKAERVWPNCGAPDCQANVLGHIVAAVALYAGHPDFLDRLDDAIRVTQNMDAARAFGITSGRILEKIILTGISAPEAVQQTIAELEDPNHKLPLEEDQFLVKHLKKAIARKDTAHVDVVLDIGQSCDYPFALLDSAHLFEQNLGYAKSVELNAAVGGDNCSRSFLVGSVLGAVNGDEIPEEWKAKTKQFPLILELAQALVAKRDSL